MWGCLSQLYGPRLCRAAYIRLLSIFFSFSHHKCSRWACPELLIHIPPFIFLLSHQLQTSISSSWILCLSRGHLSGLFNYSEQKARTWKQNKSLSGWDRCCSFLSGACGVCLHTRVWIGVHGGGRLHSHSCASCTLIPGGGLSASWVLLDKLFVTTGALCLGNEHDLEIICKAQEVKWISKWGITSKTFRKLNLNMNVFLDYPWPLIFLFLVSFM